MSLLVLRVFLCSSRLLLSPFWPPLEGWRHGNNKQSRTNNMNSKTKPMRPLSTGLQLLLPSRKLSWWEAWLLGLLPSGCEVTGRILVLQMRHWGPLCLATSGVALSYGPLVVPCWAPSHMPSYLSQLAVRPLKLKPLHSVNHSPWCQLRKLSGYHQLMLKLGPLRSSTFWLTKGNSLVS